MEIDLRVKTVISMMERSFAGDISLGTLANSVSLSPARLRQLFKRDTGLSPIKYVRRLRAKKAAYLLQTSFLSIKEIAFQSGSGDVSHFVRDFKKQYGVTPSEFRIGLHRRGPFLLHSESE